jgi:1,2-phenylacetyl-CoA epoxidase PaaB subunit
LAYEFGAKSGDFVFLLDQDVELIIILVDYFFESGRIKKIRTNFEIFFQGPKGNLEQQALAFSAQEKLKIMIIVYQGEYKKKNCRFDAWMVREAKITKNSPANVIKLVNRISQFYPKMAIGPNSDPLNGE